MHRTWTVTTVWRSVGKQREGVTAAEGVKRGKSEGWLWVDNARRSGDPVPRRQGCKIDWWWKTAKTNPRGGGKSQKKT